VKTIRKLTSIAAKTQALTQASWCSIINATSIRRNGNRLGLSDYDQLMEWRLPNWGRCGRVSDCPNPNIPSHIADLIGIAASTRDGHGETEDGEEAASLKDDTALLPLDHQDAESVDIYIRQLSDIHIAVLKARFYKFKPVSVAHLQEAVYALIDAMRANRDTVKRMRALGAP
jgi:hypothetical protein